MYLFVGKKAQSRVTGFVEKAMLEEGAGVAKGRCRRGAWALGCQIETLWWDENPTGDRLGHHVGMRSILPLLASYPEQHSGTKFMYPCQ